VKNFISIFSITLFLLILWQCNPLFEQKDEKAQPDRVGTVPVSTVKRDVENEKEIIARHLRDLSNDIDRRIRAIDDQKTKADKDVKNSLNELRTRLVREKKKVDGSLKDIQQSTEASWRKVNKKANNILTEAKIETQRIEERVENLID
jgi:cell division protein ZapA (FtsZ GTPase activity inhibitor)